MNHQVETFVGPHSDRPKTIFVTVRDRDDKMVVCKAEIECSSPPTAKQAGEIARGFHYAFHLSGPLPLPQGYWGRAVLSKNSWYMVGDEEQTPWGAWAASRWRKRLPRW